MSPPPLWRRLHPRGAGQVLGGSDRGAAVEAMGEAFGRFIVARDDIAGVIGIGGGGGTSMITAGLRRLPIGVPKLMVSTLAAGDVKPFVGASDITMMYSVTDVSGLNRISRVVLGNAAHAIAGMATHPIPQAAVKPAIGLTMFGVTTPCVTQIVDRLRDRYDCLVFHATGTGGQSMEKLVDSGMLVGVIDVTTTEICDLLVGGVLSAGPDRLGAIERSGRAVRRLGRRAGYGQLLGHGDGAGSVPQSDLVQAQSAGDAAAHDAGGVPRDRSSGSDTSSTPAAGRSDS